MEIIDITKFKNKYPKLISTFEKETGSHAIWGNKLTGLFKHWLYRKRNKFTCDICDKEFESNRGLSSHRRWHDLPEYKEFQEKFKERMSGDNHPRGMLGKHHTEETKDIISIIMEGKYIGKNHPNYGKFGKESSAYKDGSGLYTSIHDWIRNNKSKPELCELCGLPEFYNSKLGRLELSNKTGKLIRDINNFQYVHHSCHFKFDKDNDILHEGL